MIHISADGFFGCMRPKTFLYLVREQGVAGLDHIFLIHHSENQNAIKRSS